MNSFMETFTPSRMGQPGSGKLHIVLSNREFQKSRKGPLAKERNSGKMGRDEG